MVDEQDPLGQEPSRQQRRHLKRAQRRGSNAAEEPSAAEMAEDSSSSENPSAPPRGRPKRPDVTAADVTGLKYFEKLAPLLERLHDVGCERDRAGNRELHYDQLCLLLLLGLFSPVVDSLRGLQQASELE